MSESDNETPPPLPDRPDDVRGARDKPDRKLGLSSGQVVGGRFRVDRYLGSSAGAVSYQCRDVDSGSRVVLKLVEGLEEGDAELEAFRARVREASKVRHPNLTSILGMGTTEQDQVFVAMEFVDGRSLVRAVAEARERGHEVGLLEVYDVIAHIGEALREAHRTLAHGVLTPYNIYLRSTGDLTIANLGFSAALSQVGTSDGGGPLLDSVFVAPEVADGGDFNRAADLYSLAMVAAALLLEGHFPNDREAARQKALEATSKRGDEFSEIIHAALAEAPGERPESVDEFLELLEAALEADGQALDESRPDDGLGVDPAVEATDDDLFDIPDLDVDSEDEGEKRYLVRRDGLDYGPFTKEEVLEQLYDDEIDEETKIQDRNREVRSPLGEMEAFEEAVAEYIPIREERRQKEAERRAELERKVKKGGRAVLVAGIVAGLVVLSGMLYFYLNRPEPQPLPMAEAFVSYDDEYTFMPPPEDFQTVSVDDDVLSSIFNPEASREKVAETIQQAKQQRGGQAAGSAPSGQTGGGDEGGQDEVASVDMSESAGSKDALTDDEIFDIILSNFQPLRECIQKELKTNKSFSGVHVQFFVRPSGTTGGVKIKEAKYRDRPVGNCLVQHFRTMKFPAHSAINPKGVTFPLTVKR